MTSTLHRDCVFKDKNGQFSTTLHPINEIPGKLLFLSHSWKIWKRVVHFGRGFASTVFMQCTYRITHNTDRKTTIDPITHNSNNIIIHTNVGCCILTKNLFDLTFIFKRLCSMYNSMYNHNSHQSWVLHINKNVSSSLNL